MAHRTLRHDKDDSLNYTTSIYNNIKEEQINNKKNEIDKNKIITDNKSKILLCIFLFKKKK